MKGNGVPGFLVIAVCLMATIARNYQYRNTVSLWEDVVSKSLSKPRPRLNLGRAYQIAGDGNQAMREFQNAALLAMATDRPKDERLMVRQFAAVNMGEMLMSTGDPRAIMEAERIMSQVWNEDPGFPGLANNLAIIYSLDGRYGMAVKILDFALTRMREYPMFIDGGKLRLNRAMALKAMGRCAEALPEFQLAAKESADVHDAGPQQCP